jgi:hypothetical protein
MKDSMNDLVTARAAFLKKVEDHVSGESARFAMPLEELISWSEANGLAFTSHGGVHDLLKFSIPGENLAFWLLTPRPGDGAKLNLLGSTGFPENLRTLARDELALIDGMASKPEAPPVLSFTKMIWGPYRARILALMGRLLDELRPVAD